MAVQIFGGTLVLVGLLLFIRDHLIPSQSSANVSAWKINLSGPPALVLIVVGAVVFLFPFTPWWPQANASPFIPTVTTLAAPATTTPPTETTTTEPPEILAPEPVTGMEFRFAEECEDYALVPYHPRYDQVDYSVDIWWGNELVSSQDVVGWPICAWELFLPYEGVTYLADVWAMVTLDDGSVIYSEDSFIFEFDW